MAINLKLDHLLVTEDPGLQTAFSQRAAQERRKPSDSFGLVKSNLAAPTEYVKRTFEI
jgi:hypothetical protein